MSEIKHGDHMFYIEENGEVVAKVTYVPSGTDENGREILNLNHTFVHESLGGQGVGKKLVNRLAEYAREENKVIAPTCSYAKKVLESKEEYQDVLKK